MHESKQRIFSLLSIKENALFMQVQSALCVCVYPRLGECRLLLGSHLKNTTDLFGFFCQQGLVTGSTYGTDLGHYSNEYPVPLLSCSLPNQQQTISAVKTTVILVEYTS